MKPTLILLAALFAAVPLHADLSVRRVSGSKLDVAIAREPLSRAVAMIAPHLPFQVDLLNSSDPLVTYRARGIGAETALRSIVRSAGLSLAHERGRWWIHDPREPLVTLDVKDADVRVILASVQRQCGIRNLIVDPEVQGKGTFFFREVPCGTALRTVAQTLGLAIEIEPNSVATVGARK